MWSSLLVKLLAVEQSSTASLQREDMYNPADVNFCLCKAWCPINLLNLIDCSADIILSRALNQIVGVIKDSMDMDLGFPLTGALLSLFEPRGESIHIISPVWPTVQDGGLLETSCCPARWGEGLVLSLLDILGEVLVAISLVDESSGCTWDVALTKGDCPLCLMAIGLGATVCPMCSRLFWDLSLSPVVTGGIHIWVLFYQGGPSWIHSVLFNKGWVLYRWLWMSFEVILRCICMLSSKLLYWLSIVNR